MLPDIKYRLTMKSNKTDLCFSISSSGNFNLSDNTKKENLRVRNIRKKI